MIRLFLAVLAVPLLTCLSDIEKDLDEIFGQIPDTEESNVVPQCNDVSGDLKGCHECYPCDNFVISSHQSRGHFIETLQIRDASCNGTRVCCIAQLDLFILRSKGMCGNSNPEGNPRRRRPTLRSVLPGEYPWRAWILNRRSNEVLCAATYISENAKALIVPASCVSHLSEDSLAISFDKTNTHNPTPVDRIIVHESFDSAHNYNDVALVTFPSFESIPRWASPVCLYAKQPAHATPCLTVTDDDKYINSVIPSRNICGTSHESLACAVAPPHDYVPQKGAGLFCLEQNVLTPSYVLHGMALFQEDEAVTIYTSVSHYFYWIHNALHLPLPEEE